MTNDEILQATDKYLMANYGRLPLATVKASGATVWDAAGNQYVDLFAGFGAGGWVIATRKWSPRFRTPRPR